MVVRTPSDPDPAPAKQRRPGRPAARTTDAGQRNRLIDAAVTLFARHGVTATSTKAIAAEAGVTPALVHYYFRDRELLLDAVFDERLQPLIEQAFSAVSAGPIEDIAASILALAGQMIRTAAATPWFPGLWIREIVGTDGHLRERLLHRVALRRASLVMGPLAAARAQGKLTPGLEPALIMVSLVGLALLPLATTHIWRNLPGAAQIDTETLVRHVTALLAHGLSAGDPTPDN